MRSLEDDEIIGIGHTSDMALPLSRISETSLSLLLE